jgi:hypothetical protein
MHGEEVTKSRPTTSSVVHVHDHVSRRRGTFFQRGNYYM